VAGHQIGTELNEQQQNKVTEKCIMLTNNEVYFIILLTVTLLCSSPTISKTRLRHGIRFSANIFSVVNLSASVPLLYCIAWDKL